MIHHIGSSCFILLAGVITLSAQEPSSSCNATHFCNYSSSSLTKIYFELSDDILGLDLSFNNIQQINSTDLKSAVGLRTLLLQSNQIQTIDEDAFDFLVRLEHLDLSNNKLARLLPSWFKTLFSLQKLNIKGNCYLELGNTQLFSNLHKLRYLYLGNNKLSALRTSDFEGISFLKELEIEGQSFTQYESETLSKIRHIEHIILNAFPTNTLLVAIVDMANSVEFLELRNMHQFKIPSFSPSKLLNIETVKKVILRNIEISDLSVVHITSLFAGMKRLTEMEFVDSVLHGIGDLGGIEAYKSTLKVVAIRNITVQRFYEFTDLRFVDHLVQNITKLTIQNSQVYLVPFTLARSFHSLLYLDLSVNLLIDAHLEFSLCKSCWPKLETLNVSQNNLKHIGIVARSANNLDNLVNLDISQNSFEDMPTSCAWPKTLLYLNISGCKLNLLTNCIPESLKVLDVSNNNLKVFNLKLPNLQELYIKKNKLETLPDGTFVTSLRILNIRENQIFEFNEQQIRKFKNLTTLDARGNSFKCTCEFVSFVQSEEQITKMFVDWPRNYICNSPDYAEKQQVAAVRLRVTDCHKTLIVSLICISMVLFILTTAVLCYKFHALWYIRMIWAWLQAKRKPRRAHNKEIDYDAFVSYSEQDSEWVENIMVQELEQANPPFKLCLHKRDFMPGKWIVDNIIDSIEKSYKTIFVLSEHFVQSEWCKYELDFSHFRLFDENNDGVILILLEHIPEQTVPKRFCKLRKLMNTRTYLEWPENEDEQHKFWFNLKTAVRC